MKPTLLRQSFLGTNSDFVFDTSRVAIVGLGGGGSHIVQQLAHIGVGDFLVVDDDKAEESNLNRLVGATLKDASRGILKSTISERVIKRINPTARVRTIAAKWQEHHTMLRDRDIVFGCVDSYRDRSELEAISRRYLIPYIDIGMDVSEGGNGFVISGQMILSMPGSVCLRCVGFITDQLLAREAEAYGAAGGRPQVIWPNAILASLAVSSYVQLLTPWDGSNPHFAYYEYDGNSNTVTPSNRLLAMCDKVCSHFTTADLGDPFWIPEL